MDRAAPSTTVPEPLPPNMPDLLHLSVTQIALGAGGLIALAAYVSLIVVPAWTSYGRWWERIGASFMTLFMLATLVGIGVGIGAAIVWSWDQWLN
jgi:hypothetical protein